ncbi:unnamed protein product [Meloidogyne enterolobii]|uniref:Uncharacterized protein n=1 Tax=Meloidogyne enterolobii TaxID=390850 RepID=A0ACB0Z188_MELEN
MYYFKLIFYIFLLIFINVSVEKTKGKRNNLLFHRRCKRGNNFGCFGGGSRSNQPLRQREGKAHVQQGRESKRRNSKRALYIFDNFFYSHVQLHVNIF